MVKLDWCPKNKNNFQDSQDKGIHLTDRNYLHLTKITNLKPVYDKDENARLRLYARQKDWSPTIYTKATANIATEIIDDAYSFYNKT